METSKNTPNSENIVINNQEFQKVGNMNSVTSDQKHAPKNYDLYQDTESGALMGEIPEDRRNSFEIEKKIESLDIDLTTAKPEDLVNFIIDHKKDIKIYGSYVLTNRITGKVTEFPPQKLLILPCHPDKPSYDEYCMLVAEKDRKYLGIPFERLRYDDLKIEKNTVSENGKSRLNDDIWYQFFFSFYEIPEGLLGLMEKREAGE